LNSAEKSLIITRGKTSRQNRRGPDKKTGEITGCPKNSKGGSTILTRGKELKARGSGKKKKEEGEV